MARCAIPALLALLGILTLYSCSFPNVDFASGSDGGSDFTGFDESEGAANASGTGSDTMGATSADFPGSSNASGVPAGSGSVELTGPGSTPGSEWGMSGSSSGSTSSAGSDPYDARAPASSGGADPPATSGTSGGGGGSTSPDASSNSSGHLSGS